MRGNKVKQSLPQNKTKTNPKLKRFSSLKTNIRRDMQ